MAEHSFTDPLLEVYIHENSQLLEQLEQIILDCEHSNAFPPESVNEIFRIMHTIKGSSTMMGFSSVAALAHAMEDLFDYLRKHKPQLSDYSTLSDLVLQGGDFTKLELYKIRNGQTADADESSLVDSINRYLAEIQGGGQGPYERPTAYGSRPDPQPGGSGLHPELSPSHSWKAVLFFDDAGGMESVRAFQVVHSLKDLTGHFIYWPDDIVENESSAEAIRNDGFHIWFGEMEVSVDAIRECISQSSSIKRLELLPLNQARTEEQQSLNPQTASEAGTDLSGNDSHREAVNRAEPVSGSSHQTSFISVNVQKLDELMDLVGELVIAESMVTQNPHLSGPGLEQFRKASRQLRKMTDEIQGKVMSIRMVPLTGTFQKMHRIVRDMCRKQQKNIRLELVGEDTEVDKNIIEHISDPIMHLVRNAIDHGIETPEERTARGKPPAATLTLEATNVGSEVLIRVRDNGRGLNKDNILRRAKEHGLLPKAEEELTDREIYHLIFLPGFSTKETITEFSGRGVGMDVVMKNIESVGGNVSADSQAGEGTTITIRIPLTLAIIDGMNVKVGNARYTIPTTAIKQSFRPERGSLVMDPDGNEMIMVRGECYSILRLYERYGVATDIVNIEEGILIMVEQGDAQLCLFADELIGQQQVVVKSLPAYIKKLKNIRGLAGCTVLGDGSISLILDVGGLVHTSQ